MAISESQETSSSERHQRWTLADLPWERVRRAAPGEADEFFYLVAGASFMEATTGIYTGNLVEQFAGDAEITGWLEEHWLPEELQHGTALRHYVETAWPEFDWPRAYGPFVEEFRAICERDAVEDRKSLEMASRCVVEMGTASYYTTLARASPDPVLSLLARRIVEDEVRHYKHFYRFFRRYREVEETGRGSVLPALWRRLRMTAGDDSFTALKHVYLGRHPGAGFDRAMYRGIRRRCASRLDGYFPHRMSVLMLLKPLDLPHGAHRVILPIVETLARRFVP
jgi:hypothetical protein